jgi:hypothetical protein
VSSIAVIGGSIFAGTGSGIFMSTDNGESWSNIGLAGQDVRSIVSSGDYLFAGTIGKGVWKMPFKITTIEEREENTTLGSLLRTYPNPSEGTLTIEIEENAFTGEIFTLEIYDMFGRNVGEFPMTASRTIDVSNLPVGHYRIGLRTTQNSVLFASGNFTLIK